MKPKKIKLFKRIVKCIGCGKKFEAGHKLRQYCDICKGKNNTLKK